MNDIISPTDRAEKLTSLPGPAFQPLASVQCAQVCGALAIAQGAFRAPRKTKEATVQGTTARGQPYNYKFKYAPLEEIVEAVKEGLSANGLARHQYLATRGDQPIIRTIIWHSSGEWIASDYPIHPTKEGAQGFASGVTYARRYGLSLALGLAPEDDDDGNLAEGNIASFDERNAQMTDGVPRGKSTARKASVQPLPPEPVAEIEKPRLIAVKQSALGKADWIGWGGELIAAVQAARTLAEVNDWLRECRAAINNAERDAPEVHKRIRAMVEAKRKSLEEPPADFMPASEASVPGETRYEV